MGIFDEFVVIITDKHSNKCDNIASKVEKHFNGLLSFDQVIIDPLNNRSELNLFETISCFTQPNDNDDLINWLFSACLRVNPFQFCDNNIKHLINYIVL